MATRVGELPLLGHSQAVISQGVGLEMWGKVPQCVR